MTVLLDVSAIVALLTGEPEAEALAGLLDGDDDRICCALGLWEAARAIARKRTIAVDDARRAVEGLLEARAVRMVPIHLAEGREALRAHARFGKGTGHPARLNMGDCFAYACARTNDARLLYKGDDFQHTDMAR